VKSSLQASRIALALMGLLLGGCYAGVRGTVKLVEGDQELAKARSAGAPDSAVYEWTMADEYMKKARDEWARSDFESAEKLVAKSKKWAAEAATLARTAGPIESLDIIPTPEPSPESPPPSLSPPRDNEPVDEDIFDDDEGVW